MKQGKQKKERTEKKYEAKGLEKAHPPDIGPLSIYSRDREGWGG
jgi:hypothetical protein